MQIRKIVKETKKEFPDLIHMSENDFFRVWKSYEDEITERCINPDNIYLQFLNIGTLGLSRSFFSSTINKFRKSLVFNKKIGNDLKIKYDIAKEKAIKYGYLIDEKINYYKDLIYYLDGYNSEKSIKSIKYFKDKMLLLENTKKEIITIIQEYDKRIIARDLEK